MECYSVAALSHDALSARRMVDEGVRAGCDGILRGRVLVMRGDAPGTGAAHRHVRLDEGCTRPRARARAHACTRVHATPTARLCTRCLVLCRGRCIAAWLRDGVSAPLRHTRVRRPLLDARAWPVLRCAAPLPVASRNPVTFCPTLLWCSPLPCGSPPLHLDPQSGNSTHAPASPTSPQVKQ